MTTTPAASASLDLDKLPRFTVEPLIDGSGNTMFRADAAGEFVRLRDVREALARRATSTSRADERMRFDTAIDAAYPIPDTPHTSVMQRANDSRAAFTKGWQAALTHRTTTAVETVLAQLRTMAQPFASSVIPRAELGVAIAALERIAAPERATTAEQQAGELVHQMRSITGHGEWQTTDADGATCIKRMPHWADLYEFRTLQVVTPAATTASSDLSATSMKPLCSDSATKSSSTTASAGDQVCADCGGNGKQWDAAREAKITCDTCKGWGRSPAPSREAARSIDAMLGEVTRYVGIHAAGDMVLLSDLRAVLAQQTTAPGDVRQAFETWMSNRGEAAIYAGDGLYMYEHVNEQAEAFRAGVEFAAPSDGEALRQEVSIMCQMLDDGEWAEHIARTRHGQHLETAITRLIGKVNQDVAQAQAGGSDARDDFAVRFIEQRAEQYLQDHADTDPETGAVVFEYGEAGREYHSTLTDLADELRAAMSAAQTKGGGDEQI